MKRPIVWYMTQGYRIRGGHEIHVLHYATELRKHGFETRVVVPNPLPEKEHLFIRKLRERGIPLVSLADEARYLTIAVACVLIIPYALTQLLRGRRIDAVLFWHWVRNRTIVRALRRRIAREAPDIIHIFGRLTDSLWPVFPPGRTVFHHATEGKVDESWDAVELSHFREFAESAAMNFAPGSGVAANVRREFGIRREIRTLFTPAPDEAESGRLCLQQAASPPRFGILCRLTEEKGIAYLLDALVKRRERHGGVSFLFAGEGHLDRVIESHINRMGGGDVRLLKHFESPTEVMSQIDVFVHPSISDAMPVAIVEALMCGKPCIVTRVGGIPDLVRDGVEGLLISPGSSEEIVSAMERFLRMPADELTAFRKRARARYEEVCIPAKVGTEVAGCYREILGLVWTDMRPAGELVLLGTPSSDDSPHGGRAELEKRARPDGVHQGWQE